MASFLYRYFIFRPLRICHDITLFIAIPATRTNVDDLTSDRVHPAAHGQRSAIILHYIRYRMEVDWVCSDCGDGIRGGDGALCCCGDGACGRGETNWWKNIKLNDWLKIVNGFHMY